jgi:hypothetical protein
MSDEQPDRRYLYAALGCGLLLAFSAFGAVVGAAVVWRLTPGAVEPVEAPVLEPAPTPPPKPAPPPSGPKLPAPALTEETCGQLTAGAATDGCLTGTLSCDQTVVGHTLGGVKRFDTAFWREHKCWPDTVNHDSGDERAYRLTLPAGEWTATITLDTPCADLDMMAFEWSGQTCPPPGAEIERCESGRYPGKRREQVRIVTQEEKETTWFVVVEGGGTEEGAYALQVACEKGLR